MTTISKITPCLWFNTEAEEAANFYTTVFPNSQILGISRYSEVGPGEPGSVMTVDFELDGQRFTALNGGPEFSFNEAISFQVPCNSSEDVDYFWGKLSEGGEEGPCGWLRDRFGVSWQVVPNRLLELIADPDQAKADRVLKAMLGMKKIEISGLEAAASAS